MSKLVHLLYWFVIFGFSVLLWQAYSDEPAHVQQASSVPLDQTTLGASRAVTTRGDTASTNGSQVAAATQQRVDKAKIAEQHKALESLAPQNSTSQLENLSGEMGRDEATARMMEQLQRVKSYPERMQSEGVDQDWGYQVSSDVERIFSEVTGLSQDYLGEVNCRMSLCEVNVSANTTAPIDTMMRLQKALIDMPWYTEDYSTIFDATDNNGYYRIYLERESP